MPRTAQVHGNRAVCSGTAWTWTQPGALKADRPSRLSAAEWTPSRRRGSVPIPPRLGVSDVKSGRARPGSLPLSRPLEAPGARRWGPSVMRRPPGDSDPCGLIRRPRPSGSLDRQRYSRKEARIRESRIPAGPGQTSGGPASPTVAPGPRGPAPRGIPRPGACRRCIAPCTRAHARTHARTHARHTHTRTDTHTQTNRSDTELQLFPVTRATAFGRQKRPPNLGRAHAFAFRIRVRSSALCRIASGATESRR
jgi:hypothetical protein